MKILRFWARSYRSLRELRLDPLRDFNVFYGPNGSGKSNVLDALEALHRALRAIATEDTAMLLNVQRAADASMRPLQLSAGRRARDAGWIHEEDLTLGTTTGEFVLGAEWEVHPGEQRRHGLAERVLSAEVTCSVLDREHPRVWLSRLRIGGDDAPAAFDRVAGGIDGVAALLRAASFDFFVVGATRLPAEEVLQAVPDEHVSPVRYFLERGLTRNALFAASTDRDHVVRERWRSYRALLQGAPLSRPAFDVTLHPQTRALDVRELAAEGDVSIRRVGLGVAQLYAALAGVVLSAADMVGLEEPEAHLHAPTTGLQFREMLGKVLESRKVDQLFVATHSNLFDLDPEGYWDVSLREGATVVEWRPLSDADRHFYEPGPAKHALAQFLRYASGDEVVFRRPDGAEVTAAEMLRLLRDDDPTALAFLQNLHGAALRVTRVGARRPRDVQ